VLEYGPDGYSNWDRMERMGIYRSHLLNSTNASSHGGATIHAFGVKVPFDTYGCCPEKPLTSLSGKSIGIMMEARDAGMATCLINSGHICEPGTGVFAAGAAKRSMTDEISDQIIHSGVDIIFSGGEELMLPEGVTGHHGRPGVRSDGKNLIEEAKQLGYTVVYDRDEMLALPDETEKVLGVFAARHTFNAMTEEKLQEQGLPFYNEGAPSVAEMTETALRILTARGK
jgi:alkaline phosphatase